LETPTVLSVEVLASIDLNDKSFLPTFKHHINAASSPLFELTRKFVTYSQAIEQKVTFARFDVNQQSPAFSTAITTHCYILRIGLHSFRFSTHILQRQSTNVHIRPTSYVVALAHPTDALLREFGENSLTTQQRSLAIHLASMTRISFCQQQL